MHITRLSWGAVGVGLALLAPSRAAADPPDGAAEATDAPPPLPEAAVVTPDEPPTEAAAIADDDQEMLRYPPSSARTGLLVGGLGITAATYGASLACALGWPEVPGADYLQIPVVGPWVTLGYSGCSEGEEDCDAILVIRTILLVLDGLGQLGGLGLAAEGIFMTTEAEPDAPAAEKPATVSVAPFVTEHTTGLGLVGTF